jgi:hypothetical protein
MFQEVYGHYKKSNKESTKKMKTLNVKEQIAEKKALINRCCTGSDAISLYNKNSLNRDIKLLELLETETYTLEDYEENISLPWKHQFMTINEKFNCFVNFEGFEIGNELDSDVVIRFFGNDSGSIVAHINALVNIKDNYYKTEIDLISTGKQYLIVIDYTAGEEICNEYFTTLDVLLDDLNNCNCKNKVKYNLYKELLDKNIIEFRNSSWFEPRVVIKDLYGNIKFNGYEKGTLDEIYDSIKNFNNILDNKKEFKEYIELYLNSLS